MNLSKVQLFQFFIFHWIPWQYQNFRSRPARFNSPIKPFLFTTVMFELIVFYFSLKMNLSKGM